MFGFGKAGQLLWVTSKRCDVGLFFLQRDNTAGRLRHLLEDDLVEVGATFDEVVIKAFHDDVFARLELFQLERAGADDVLAVLGVLTDVVRVAVDVFRDDHTQLR